MNEVNSVIYGLLGLSIFANFVFGYVIKMQLKELGLAYHNYYEISKWLADRAINYRILNEKK